MNKICCIIDMDGFTHRISDNGGLTYRNIFLIRELGYVCVSPRSLTPADSYRFDLRGQLDVNKCSANELKTLEHQSRKIMGLPIFSTARENAVNYDDRWNILRHIYDKCRKDGLDIIAYKGGNREKEYLVQLDIPHVNLELFGCPKFESLVGKSKNNPSECGHHNLASKNMIVHCAEAEVSAYRDWLLTRMREYELVGRCGASVKPSLASYSAPSYWDPYSSSDSD